MAGHAVEVATTDTTIEQAGVAPASTERLLAEVLADVVRSEHVSVDSNFFDDLGADSMVMAQFCARVRKREDLPSVSMKDIYRYPTISSLAAALAEHEPVPAAAPPAPAPAPAPVGRAQYALCATLQVLAYLGYAYLAALVLTQAYEWISAGTTELEIYLHALVVGAVAFTSLCLLPVAAKWLLVGRWKAGEIRIWSLAYFRFWLVKTLMRTSPLALFAGSPLYVVYLRMLGARIGRGVVVLTKHIPVCTDLITIGEGTVVRKDAFLNGYRAQAGMIQRGPVTLGRDVYVGEASVLDIGTSMGDGSLLGRSSSLHAGQTVPAGERWHGSPAQRTGLLYPVVPPVRCGSVRRFVYSVLQLLVVLVISLPLLLGGAIMLLAGVPKLAALLEPHPIALTTWIFYLDALGVSLVLFAGSLVLGLIGVAVLPRLLRPAVRIDRTYRLYGIHWWAQRVIGFLTNRKFFMMMFGDSSYVVHYLRWIGYDLSHVVQTGSNFGTEVKHDNPFAGTVGSGTMVADGLSLINTEYSNTSFRVSRSEIGPHNFLGNHIVYPPGGRTGDNCLLATKVGVPVDGPMRENAGLLGSPSMQIPRSVQRDSSFEHLETGDELRRRLAHKNRHNVVTIGWFLLVRWLHLFVATLLLATAADLYDWLGISAVALISVLLMVFGIGYNLLVDRIVTTVHPQRPMFCSIYDIRFWRHERFWKVPETDHLQLFNGTPLKAVLWRLMGARIGKRVFDDGCYISERKLVAVGDDSVLNAGSKIQCHSQEDGTFKSDRSTLGAGCTVGTGALVHYGVTMGDGVVLAPDSFLMKGEEIPNYEQWGGNPAHETRPVQRLTGGMTR